MQNHQDAKQLHDNQIEPDFLLRRWMMPYLPKSPLNRDLVMMVASSTITLSAVLLVWPLLGDTLSIVIASMGVGYLAQRYWYRSVLRTRKNAGR